MTEFSSFYVEEEALFTLPHPYLLREKLGFLYQRLKDTLQNKFLSTIYSCPAIEETSYGQRASNLWWGALAKVCRAVVQ